MVSSANFGGFEQPIENAEQTVPVDSFRFTDENFPPRYMSMTPRMQAKIPKMFTWQLIPGYDIYIWVDSSITFPHPTTVQYLLEQLGDDDIAFFRHPQRRSIQDECNFLKRKLNQEYHYIVKRYSNEPLDDIMDVVKSDKDFVDNLLISAGIFIYRNKPEVHKLMKDWWHYVTRYHINDQLSLPYVISKSKCKVKIIDQDYRHTRLLSCIRKYMVPKI